MTERCWLRRLVVAFALLSLAILLVPASRAGGGHGGWIEIRTAPWRLSAARDARVTTWACERSLRVVPVSGYPDPKWMLPLEQRRLQTLKYWRRRQAACSKSLRLVGNPRHWLCIQGYEGRWNDPGAPYYGGLQMNYGFMATYGRELLRRKGTADHWTPLEQMIVAERARRSGRGYYPWPNTARWCGLI